MPIGSSLRMKSSTGRSKKTFPDIKTGGGRYSGLLAGVQTAMQQGQVNQQNQLNQAILGMQMQNLLETQKHRKELVGLKKRELLTGKASRWDSLLNNANDIIAAANKSIIEANRGQPLFQTMSLDDIKASNGKPMFKPVPVGSGLMPSQGRGFGGKIGSFLKGLGKSVIGRFQEGGIVDRPQMAMVGEQGREFIVPEDKLDPNMAAQLEQIVGPRGQAQQGQQGQEITTEQLIATLDDYAPEDIDQAIEDLIALDQEVNQPGLQLPDNIDYEAFKQAFIQKFGEEGFRRLEARVGVS